MEWSEGGGKWDNGNSIINKYIFKKTQQHISCLLGKFWVQFLRQGTRQRRTLFSPLLFSIVLRVIKDTMKKKYISSVGHKKQKIRCKTVLLAYHV